MESGKGAWGSCGPGDGRSVAEIRDGHRGKRMSGTGTNLAGPKKRPGPPPGSLAEPHLV